MEIADIANRCNLAPRRLRYVVDRGVVPVAERSSHGRGSPRRFSPLEAISIALAAALIDAGIHKGFVRTMIGAMLKRIADKGSSSKVGAPPPGTVGIMELADGQHMRIRTSDDPDDPGFNPPWRPKGTKPPLDPNYRPLVVVSIDAAELRLRLFGTAAGD